MAAAAAASAHLPLIAGNLIATGAHYPERRFATRQRIMALEKAIEIEGTITSVLPGTMFRVSLNGAAGNGNGTRKSGNGPRQVLAHISGKMRKRFIRLTIGDRVKMEMSPYDMEKARIVYRL